MDRATALARLRASEAELRSLGVDRLAIFGSVARGEETPESDVDLAARLDPEARIGMFRYMDISGRLEEMLGVRVDLVAEPNRNPRVQAQIDRDRIDVF